MNSETGEIFVTRKLDREKKSLYLLIVKITENSTKNETTIRLSRQTLNPINECKYFFLRFYKDLFEKLIFIRNANYKNLCFNFFLGYNQAFSDVVKENRGRS